MLTENLLFLLLKLNFLAQNCHYFNCVCFKYQQFQNLLKQIKKNKFFTSNSKQKKWFIIFHRKLGSKVTLFPVFI